MANPMQKAAPNVEDIFSAALELQAPEARSAFLDRVCGDTGLRRDVEQLLALDAGANDFLEAPAAMPTVTAAHESHLAIEEVGTVIGPYKLLEAVGEGGMGTVYMAEQTEPVRRRVALKVIKPGMDSKQVVARFEAERQALAMMDHPNIAKVHDAGTTPSGRPYFVMELVRGLPVTEYCDRHELSIPERLELFVLVCRAVQHAHQKGVIHRDLKPSNVLVTDIDGVAVPKVIDFGVAKATGGALTEKTLFTGFHQFVGTPLYASPEQAELSGADVDTRSDLYSLGVLLYELLTGTTPFDSERLRRAAFDEMRRVLRDEEPPRPSTRLSTLGDQLSTVSARRKADPRRLCATMKGELDWVVMKSLEKDRRRRYETASDFAADVMNYLADRPVGACPPTAWYRLGKFARRNRPTLVTGGFVACALVVGAAVSTWQAVRATQAQRETNAAFVTARRAVDEMYSQFAEEWIAKQPRLTKVQSDFIEKALAFYEQFASLRPDDPQATFEAALAWRRVGNIRQKLGRVELAEAAYRTEVEQFDRLAAHFPERADYASEAAFSRLDLGAVMVRRGDRHFEVEPVFKRSVADLDALAARHPEDREVRGRLAWSLYALGALHRMQRRNEDAERVLLRSRELFKQLSEGDPIRLKFQRIVPTCEIELGRVYKETGRLTEAEAAFRGAAKLLETFLGEEPRDPVYRSKLAEALKNASDVLCTADRPAEAFECIRRAVALLDALAEEFPDELDYSDHLETCLDNLFLSLHGHGERGEAERVGLQGVKLSERLLRVRPADPKHRDQLSKFLSLLADLHSEDTRGPMYAPEEALKLARRAVEVDPIQGLGQQSLGWARYRAGNWKGCIESLEKQPDYQRAGDFIAAMAYWHLGDRAKAREVFTRTEEWLARYERHWKPGIYPTSAMLRRFRSEAESLLRLEPTGTGRPPG
ncbi:serine/threonine-protein kinase [Isosphaeraceae bacterium EP7]